ncbi:MAG TPA: TldD/PmbA family protein [Candidatus Tectomicrobia bacterium]|nr:TldD/PmbA family protein [Candidatus Tectomicrobia bacterium]
MGIERELAGDLLVKVRRQGATEADLVIVETDSSNTQVRLREVESLKSAQERRLHLRVMFDKCSAATSTSDFSMRALDRLVDETCTLARATAPDAYLGLPAAESTVASIPDLGLCDEASQALEVEDKIALVKRAEEAALDYDVRITNSEGAGLDTHFSRIVYANTHGFVGGYRTSSFTLAVSPIAGEGGAMQRDSWYAVSRQFKQLEAPEVIGETAAKRALRRLGARKITTQEAPVVFDPEMAASLLRTLAGAVSGTSIYRGSSFLLNRLRQQVAADGVTIIDDGTIPGALGSRPFDAEGMPTTRTVVIEHGVLQSYLLDTYCARRLGLTSTGNAARDAAGISVGSSNFYLVPGTITPTEIIASVKSGLYLTELIGFGVNLVTGDYSRGAVGLWIENGELAYPVEEITIAGNLNDMLRHIEMVGNDLVFRGRTAAPTLKIGRMTIAGN